MKWIAFLLLFSSNLFAQIGGEGEIYLTGDRIEAKFNGGGLDKFYDYINANFNFSKVTKPGRLVTSFIIDENGDVKNCKVVQFVDIESATEIIRVLKSSPKWSPALKGGNPISITINFPFDIKVVERRKSD